MILYLLDANDRYSDGKATKIRLPKNMQLSYAAVVGPKRVVKHSVNSNHRAHKAWEDRNGTAKKPADAVVSKPAPNEDIVVRKPQKVWQFTPVVSGRRFRNIPLHNRFSILSRAIL